jgi:two-component system, NarL family, sensor histidine kinase UhpB
MIAGATSVIRARAPESPGLYWKVSLINAVVFVCAAAVLVGSPATVSAQVTGNEMAVLLIGTVIIIVVNALLVRRLLAPLDRLVREIDSLDSDREHLDERAAGVAGVLAHSFNALQARLDAERAKRAAAVINAQEDERRRIAQELHDEVGQRLTVVLLGLTRALNQSAQRTYEELHLVRDHVRTSLDEVKRVVRGLRPGVLEELGLGPALESMAKEVSASTGISVETRLHTDVPRLVPAAQLVFFRVAQEALTNCSRHSSATRVLIALSRYNRTVTLRVVDDGRTIQPGAVGDGIRGMQERARAVNGTLVLGEGDGGVGTALELVVPLGEIES